MLLIAALLLYWGAGSAGLWLFGALGALPLPVAALLAFLGGLVTLVGEVGLASALLPRLKAGAYPLLKHPIFFSWLFRSMLRRILWFPPLKTILFTSNVLRWLSLRALGAKVSFTANMSSDVDLLDPALTSVGAGATLGTRCMLAAHYVKDGNLVLAPIEVGAGALLGAHVMVAPGARFGARALILSRGAINQDCEVGEGAIVGADVRTEPGVQIEAGSKVPSFEILRR